MQQQPDNINLPLCVDLDGTLVRTDTLHEHLLSTIFHSTLSTLYSAKHLLTGKARFKSELSNIRDFSADHLPVNEQVTDLIASQPSGRETILVTGASSQIANAVAEKTGLFTSVMSSDDQTNLTGEIKRQKLVNTFGEKGFDYIGNDYVDMPVFESANRGYLISRDEKLIQSTKDQFSHVDCLKEDSVGLKEWLKLLRAHHWVKNVLIFIPLFLEHRLFDADAVISAILCFIAFSLLASLTYILNDLHDLKSDRQNTVKSTRPLASGLISISASVKVVAALLAIFLVLLLILPKPVITVLLFYLVATLSYTLFIKQILFLDVSLALAKRVAELKNLGKENRTDTVGRGYAVDDETILLPAGVSAGNISVLIVALYINSDKVINMYNYPEFLWGLCPLLIYWLGRVWIVTARGYMTEDPLVYALKDRVSSFLLFIFFACIVLASPA